MVDAVTTTRPPTSLNSEQLLDMLTSRYLNIFLVGTYLILPSVATMVFQTFLCEDIDPSNSDDLDDVYMRVDYR